MGKIGMRQARQLGWAALLASSSAFAQSADTLPLTPLPAAVVLGSGTFTVRDGAVIATPPGDAGAATAARVLAAHVKTERGLTLTSGAGTAAITFARDATVSGDEAYRLIVDTSGIRVTASGDRGLLYGAMSVAQLLSPDRAFGKAAKVPALSIEDAPRFGWRGLLMDVARHFQPIKEVYKIVDQMASVKLNTLHLHLTDDQGWRFEVKRYPKLTEVGGWRTPPSSGGPVGPKHGGFYTQDQLKALVAYAAERGVTIVPEIDLPGHAQALAAAYPEFSVFADAPKVGHDWGVMPYLFNPAPEGIQFVKNVLDELIEVFPGTFIHLGGDEAIKDQWERSPKVQAQIKALGLKSENQLQSWMIEQFGTYLATKGRRLIGWDEILEGGLPASASVMSWRGEKGAVEAANQGHDVVLSPSPLLYLDQLQSNLPDEWNGRLAVQSLEKIYRYEPIPVGIDADRAKHVLGAQGNAWSEYLITPQQMQHAFFPRAAAIAEMTWSAKDKRDFSSFLDRVQPQIGRWRRSGMHVSDGAFAVAYQLQGSRGDALRANKAVVALSTQASYGTIRYTTNGSEPTSKSPAYQGALTLKPGVTIRAAAFDKSGNATAAARAFDTGRAALLTRTTSDLAACPGGNLYLRVPLTPDATANAPVYNIELYNNCSAYPAAPLDVARGFTVSVARLARHWGLAHDTLKRRDHYPATMHGELLVTARCTAAAKDKTIKPILIGSFALPDPETAPNQFTFSGTIPEMQGDEDLCFQFTSPLSAPFYTVEKVELTEGASK
ncbi:beta-N-acetylhexosaminidase [Sphingomonas xinjiangensis]|uniref:beta-N-acetylhexosaminidase n=1 Tax=Sphingomonas xinjiangensis TaxID=643568 RepID=A0A840YGK1_9SPHN|nr:family 20 glycosylhydrolase [Sphingomonas xinjiangensis]MBB5709918.1 hexosaminidase [Sphingomonas xinjiangensis]